MLSPKENYLAVLNHEKPDFVPDMALDVIMVGGAFETFENGPLGGGVDDFGLEWVCTASANSQATPAPGCFPVPDVTEWKKYLKIPDLAKYDWEEMAKMQFAGQDRDKKAVVYGTWNSIFLRFSHLLGFEEALIAMYEEPEACMEMMQAIADYKCDLIEMAAKYFKPDVITHYDDVCTERGPFMPPELYREMIKPFHKQMDEAAKSFGVRSDSMEWHFRFADFTLDYICEQIGSEIPVHDLTHPAFEELAAYDASHGTQLLETARIYMECEFNVSSAAKRLDIHRSSMLARLERIDKLTQFDWSNFRECTHLALSFLLDDSGKR